MPPLPGSKRRNLAADLVGLQDRDRYISYDITAVLLDEISPIRHRLRQMARLFIRIDFEPSGSALGPGMVQLLEGIVKHGSLRRAAAAMGMSYRKAWLLIQSVQKTFDGPVVTAEVGGATGGGTVLTELGTNLLKLYHRVESRAADATKAELDQLSAMIRATATPRRAGRRKRAAKN
jgi:molybdate transport system regulatory protein